MFKDVAYGSLFAVAVTKAVAYWLRLPQNIIHMVGSLPNRATQSSGYHLSVLSFMCIGCGLHEGCCLLAVAATKVVA